MPEDKENNKDQQKKDLNDLSQTHGKVEKFRPTTLDQVWGDEGSWKYNTMDETEYRGILEGMPKSDLVSHANRIGLIPIDDRTQLIKRLIVEFRRHVTAYRSPHVQSAQNKPLSKEAEKILKEGR
tara:strand:+ start:648 stop:1022 length:375 start_codon:yes stop_codon:yes gene_type:complete